MALNAYLSLKAQKQGVIKGGCTQRGREGTIEVIEVHHQIISPRDAASGLPAGKRVHHPLVIYAETGIQDPLLYQALTNNENLPEWVMNFWEPNAAGVEKNYYRIELANANVSSVHFDMLNNRDPSLMRYKPTAHWGFTYQKITWTVLWPTTISTTDDWEAPST